MKDSINNELLKVWDESSQLMISSKEVALDRRVYDRMIASVFSNGPFYYFILDLTARKVDFVSPEVESIHGIHASKVTLEHIMEWIHPEDMPFVGKAEALCIDVQYNRIGGARALKYKNSYCFRCKTKDGSYRLFHHQAFILTSDENFKISKSLNIHTDISHLTSTNNFKVSFIGMHDEPSFLNVDVNDKSLLKESKSPFTLREKEIIRLLAEGLSSRAIAERLNISHDTVRTHRKNLMHKAECKNLGQLIAKCIKEGLI